MRELVVQFHCLGHTEVGEHHAAIVAKEDVGRLHVAVDQPAVMHHREAAGQLANDVQSPRRRENDAAMLRQVAAAEVFHGQVMAAIGDLADVVDGDDGRMAQRGDDVAFLDEAFGKGRILGAQQHLDCHLAIQGQLGGEVDLRHAALAESFVQAIAGNF